MMPQRHDQSSGLSAQQQCQCGQSLTLPFMIVHIFYVTLACPARGVDPRTSMLCAEGGSCREKLRGSRDRHTKIGAFADPGRILHPHMCMTPDPT